MIVSGHQPAYLPWLGYFHKLSLCDVFVYMDTVQYLENDWNNRNKIRTPEGAMWLTVPIDRNKTTGKMLDQIFIKNDDPSSKNYWVNKHWNSIMKNYSNTPFYKTYETDLRAMYFDQTWEKLVDLCWFQFRYFSKILGLESKKIVRMSEMQFSGEKDELVLDHCSKLGADCVVFGKMGQEYVRLPLFQAKNIHVYFQKYQSPVYQQRFKGFEPNMCILDLIFNHGPESFSILQSGNVSYNDLVTNQYWEKV